MSKKEMRSGVGKFVLGAALGAGLGVLFAPKNTNGSAQMIGFLFPNEKTTEDHFEYAVTVDEIEKLTGIDFFSQLDDSIENQLENTFNTSVWDAAN